MDNCDLEKLSISGGNLQPAFKSSVTRYNVTVASNVNKVTLDLLTSDCGASYKIFCGDGSNTIHLNDGLNVVDIEVVAEDGTSKTYSIDITKLSARTAVLSDLAMDGDVQLHPAFSANICEYSSTVSFYCTSVTMLPKVPDENMKVLVNGESSSMVVSLNVGDTMVEIKICSADGSNSQIYTVSVTREQIPIAVTFTVAKDSMEYECPVSLTTLYRPVSINKSEPKHIFSGPYIDMLARRSKVDPLNERPLGDSWKVPEPDLDGKMSGALVKCFFAYRGCESVVKLAEVGSHALQCPHKPSADLDPKDVTETSWYKKYFASSVNLEIETKHTLEVRNWEKQLQKAIGGDNVDNLCILAQDYLKLYRQRLPKPGDMLQYEEGQSPLDSLEQAIIHYASAIKLKPRDPRFHFLLGQALEEQHYATEMYGLKKKPDGDSEEVSGAKATSLQEDILALCTLHGFTGTPTLENQLKAVDTEYHQLKDQGQSGKADYVQTLYSWLSKKAGKDGSAGLRDEESCMHRACLKYLDAWCLSPDDWEFNLHTGRLLLLQGLGRAALQHLQTGLALRPCQPALRFYTGLALLQQESGASEEARKEATGFLLQGLEHVIAQCCSDSGLEQAVWEPLSSMSPHFLRGCLMLGAALQHRTTLPGKTMSGEQVYHIIAVLAAQGVCRCVCRGEVALQLEWVLLDAHFALLQGFLLAKPGTERQALVAKRCQALTGLIRLTTIAPCRELLDMQKKVCQVAVVTTPCDGHALYLLGLAQLAQFDSDPDSERSKAVLADACLSFQASLELDDKPQSGDPPTQLTKQEWWQEKLASEKEKAAKQTASQSTGAVGPSDGGATGRGSGRGRGGPGRGGVTAVTKAPGTPAKGGAKTVPPARHPVARGRAGAATAPRTDGSSKAPAKPSSKTQLSPSKSKTDCSPSKSKTDCSHSKSKTDCSPSSSEAGTPQGRLHSPVGKSKQESAVAKCPGGLTLVNRRSHAPRLGLARALSRSADTHDQACKFYQEVISMAPEVHDAYVELAEMLVKTDPLAAVEVYCRFPLRPVAEQTFDDAFITGQIVRNLMKLELYDHPQLGPSLVAYGKVMGLGCIEEYIDILDGKFKTHLLKSVYAGIHNKSVDDNDLQDFFKFKCWI